MILNEQIATEVARALLDIEAVTLSPNQPYTWASGLRAPIYCDNRRTLAFPRVRTLIARSLAQIVQEKFPTTEVIAGTATAGIAHAALVSAELDLPMAYVRAAAKDHGRGKQIEGLIEPGQKVVLVEDLISTGGSVLRAAEAVREAGAEVLGVIAIFNYNLERAERAFADTPLYTLSHFPTLVAAATERGQCDPELATWSADPQAWSDRFEAP